MRHSWQSWRDGARKRIPKFVFDYIDGGAGDETCLTRNRSAFDKWVIVPRILRGGTFASTSTSIFGINSSMPVVLAPTGLNSVIRPGGDQMLASAATSCGIPFTLSTAANADFSAVIDAAGTPPWFQLYVIDRVHTEAAIRLAENVDCPVLMITADVPVGGHRHRDLRNGFSSPLDLSFKMMRDMVSRPRWTWHYFRHRDSLTMPLVEKVTPNATLDKRKLLARQFDRSFDWDDLARLRNSWRRPLVVKGVQSAEDAIKLVRLGVDGLVVSNHGGRQSDSAAAALDTLPGIASAVGDKLTVFVDGGIRNGDDVFKAMALGAGGVLIGRLCLYGLATDGRNGVIQVLEMLREEFRRSLILAGCVSIREATRERVTNQK